MIIGLLGSSCSGKSFFISFLYSIGFFVPMSVTTRPQREEEMWHLRHMDQQEFESLNKQGGLSFVTEAFGNSYACIEFSQEAVDRDVAIIITKGNIPELRKNGGLVIQILPSNPQETIDKIQLLNRGDKDRRIEELLADLANSENSVADAVFYNDYTQESQNRFSALIDELRLR
jgi:guanylate kinase